MGNITYKELTLEEIKEINELVKKQRRFVNIMYAQRLENGSTNTLNFCFGHIDVDKREKEIRELKKEMEILDDICFKLEGVKGSESYWLRTLTLSQCAIDLIKIAIKFTIKQAKSELESDELSIDEKRELKLIIKNNECLLNEIVEQNPDYIVGKVK